MTNLNKTDITYILDRSGSMSTIWTDVVKGLRALIRSQKSLPGKCNFTLIGFDDKYEVFIKETNIKKINLNLDNLYPRGRTALYYAIGKTIVDTGERLRNMPEEDRPGKVIICISTDGHNNIHKEFTRDAVALMIKHQEEVYNWEVIYTGVGIDVSEEARHLNIKWMNTNSFSKDARGVKEHTAYVGNTVSSYRGVK